MESFWMGRAARLHSRERLWRKEGQLAGALCGGGTQAAPAALLGLRPAVSLVSMAAEAERLLAPAPAGAGAPGTRRPREMTAAEMGLPGTLPIFVVLGTPMGLGAAAASGGTVFPRPGIRGQAQVMAVTMGILVTTQPTTGAVEAVVGRHRMVLTPPAGTAIPAS